MELAFFLTYYLALEFKLFMKRIFVGITMIFLVYEIGQDIQ